MLLSDVVPTTKIEAVIGRALELEHLNTGDWITFAKRDPDSMFGIAARAWHLMVTAPSSNLKPDALAPYFANRDPHLADAIEQLTGEPILKEVGFLEATVTHGGHPFVVATSAVSLLTAGELHWYDIGMENPSKPLPESERVSPVHEYKGFGLLREVASAVFKAAKERHCKVVSVTVANEPLVKIFERFGFEVEDSDLGRIAMTIGFGIPMLAPTP